MLTIFSGRGERDCSGATRRDFLRVGALSLGSLSLPNLLAAASKRCCVHGTVIQEAGKDPLAIAGRCRRCHTARLVCHRASGGPKLSVPTPLAGLGVKAEHVQSVLFNAAGTGHDHASLDHDRA